MSTTGFSSRLFDSLKATVRTPFFLTLVGTTAALSLIIVALTVTSDGAATEGTDAGRMALSFVEFIILVATLLGVPTVFVGIRERLGRLPLAESFLIALAVGLGYIVVAIPALLWSILATSVSPDVWGPTLGTLLLEVAVVAVLVSLAHWAIAHHGAAAATAFGLIAGITLGPLLVVATASFGAPIEQTTTSYYIEWKDDNQEVDPVTGYPIDPVCPTPNYSTQQLTDYSGVWAAMATNPLALVSSSITPAVGDYLNPGYAGDGFDAAPVGMPPQILPLDLFSTVDLSVREMQVPIETDITVNECENLDKYGTPYLEYYGVPDPRDVLAKSTSGFTYGLIGQAGFVLATAAVLVPIRFRKRRA